MKKNWLTIGIINLFIFVLFMSVINGNNATLSEKEAEPINESLFAYYDDYRHSKVMNWGECSTTPSSLPIDTACNTKSYTVGHINEEILSDYTENSSPPKIIYGTAKLEDGNSADGASVVISASGYPDETTIVSDNEWQVDIGADTGDEWVDGTHFTVTITHGTKWQGIGDDVVESLVTNVGEIVLTKKSKSTNNNMTLKIAGNNYYINLL